MSTGADGTDAGHDADQDADQDATPAGPDAAPAVPPAPPTAHAAACAWTRPPAASAALPPTQPALALAQELPVLATEHATEHAQSKDKDDTFFELGGTIPKD